MSQELANYDISEDAFNLIHALEAMKEALVSVYQSYNAPLPDRRYWTVGEPVLDCEQAVVSLAQVYLGTPGDEATIPQACNVPKTMVVDVTVARKQTFTNSKTSATQTPEMMTQDASWAALDTWILMDSLQAFVGDVWGGPAPTMIATSQLPTPLGGYFMTSVRMSLLVP